MSILPGKPIGDITAKCPRCGKKRFSSSAGPKFKPEDLLTCDGCGLVVPHKKLFAKMEAEFVKRADKAAGDLAKRFNKRR